MCVCSISVTLLSLTYQYTVVMYTLVLVCHMPLSQHDCVFSLPQYHLAFTCFTEHRSH